MKARVALITTTPRTIFEDYERLFRLAGFSGMEQTCLALESFGDSFYPGIAVPPWQIQAVADYLKKDSAGKNENHLTVMVRNETGKLTSPLYAQALPDLKSRFQSFNAARAHRSQIVLLATLKTHLVHTVYGSALTGALWSRPERSSWSLAISNEKICNRYEQLKKSARGLFGVIDGTFAGDGPGPKCLRLFTKNVLLASDDPVALDAVAARLMGFEPMHVPYLRALNERGLGSVDLGKIQLVGEGFPEENFRFRHIAEESSRRLYKSFRKLKVPETEPRGVSSVYPHLLEQMYGLYTRFVWMKRAGAIRRARALETSWGALLKSYSIFKS